MKKFTSCFLGIPLPKEFQQEFEQLLADIYYNDPNIEVVRPQTPHVTVYYLNKQSQFSLNEIKELVQPKMSIVNWNFKVKEIILYGIDSTESPERQEKLVTIPVEVFKQTK